MKLFAEAIRGRWVLCIDSKTKKYLLHDRKTGRYSRRRFFTKTAARLEKSRLYWEDQWAKLWKQAGGDPQNKEGYKARGDLLLRKIDKIKEQMLYC